MSLFQACQHCLSSNSHQQAVFYHQTQRLAYNRQQNANQVHKSIGTQKVINLSKNWLHSRQEKPSSCFSQTTSNSNSRNVGEVKQPASKPVNFLLENNCQKFYPPQVFSINHKQKQKNIYSETSKLNQINSNQRLQPQKQNKVLHSKSKKLGTSAPYNLHFNYLSPSPPIFPSQNTYIQIQAPYHPKHPPRISHVHPSFQGSRISEIISKQSSIKHIEQFSHIDTQSILDGVGEVEEYSYIVINEEQIEDLELNDTQAVEKKCFRQSRGNKILEPVTESESKVREMIV